jgi:hypothetical protein
MTIGIWGIKDSNAPSLTESQIETQLQVANWYSFFCAFWRLTEVNQNAWMRVTISVTFCLQWLCLLLEPSYLNGQSTDTPFNKQSDSHHYSLQYLSPSLRVKQRGMRNWSNTGITGWGRL